MGGIFSPKGFEINPTPIGDQDDGEPPKLVDLAAYFLAFIELEVIKDLITTKGRKQMTKDRNQGCGWWWGNERVNGWRVGDGSN